MHWEILFAIISSLLLFDLFFLNRNSKELCLSKSLRLSTFFIISALSFGIYIYYNFGIEHSIKYYNGYLIELALSIDNIFVISLIFAHFNVSKQYQHRALSWGIIGAIFFRGIMIYLGTSLVDKYIWILDIFAAILIFTSFHLYKSINEKPNLSNNKLVNFITKYIPLYKKESKNFIIYDKKWFITRTGIALCIIEFMDLIFAIDSIPAIFAITTDKYLVYSSNIFAIMGLRALYFTLSRMIEKFKYLKYSLVAILFLIGIKIYLHHFIELPVILPLITTIILFSAGIIYSLFRNFGEK